MEPVAALHEVDESFSPWCLALLRTRFQRTRKGTLARRSRAAEVGVVLIDHPCEADPAKSLAAIAPRLSSIVSFPCSSPRVIAPRLLSRPLPRCRGAAPSTSSRSLNPALDSPGASTGLRTGRREDGGKSYAFMAALGAPMISAYESQRQHLP
jgi:hypothetical protein